MGRPPDLSKLRQLSNRVGDLSRIPSQAARASAEKINVLLERQFEEGVDPYGRPWASLAPATLEKHGEPPLQGEFGDRPGDMASGTMATPSAGAGIQITVPFPGGIHQTGAPASNMPRRAILPDASTLPPEWKEAINESVRESVKK